MQGNFPLWPDGEWQQERHPSLTTGKRDQESCYSWNMGISYGLKSKYAGKGNIHGWSSATFITETKITLVLLMSAELFWVIFSVISQYLHILGLALRLKHYSRWRDRCFKLKNSVVLILAARFLFQRIRVQATERAALTSKWHYYISRLWTQSLQCHVTGSQTNTQVHSKGGSSPSWFHLPGSVGILQGS